MSGPYPHLLSPGQIGGLTLRNRVVMVPIDSIFSTEDGASNERHRAYLAARAKGGVGLSPAYLAGVPGLCGGVGGVFAAHGIGLTPGNDRNPERTNELCIDADDWDS